MVAEHFTNQQIADVFQRLRIKTPRGKDYYAELIGATVSKLRKRDLRKNPNAIKFLKMILCRREEGSHEQHGAASEDAREVD